MNNQVLYEELLLLREKYRDEDRRKAVNAFAQSVALLQSVIDSEAYSKRVLIDRLDAVLRDS